MFSLISSVNVQYSVKFLVFRQFNLWLFMQINLSDVLKIISLLFSAKISAQKTNLIIKSFHKDGNVHKN